MTIAIVTVVLISFYIIIGIAIFITTINATVIVIVIDIVTDISIVIFN